MRETIMILTLVGGLTGIGFTAWAASIFMTRWEKKGRGAAGGATSRELEAVHDRLGRLEQAMEAVAVEVERISEGQRFTTKLLSERARVDAALLPPQR